MRWPTCWAATWSTDGPDMNIGAGRLLGAAAGEQRRTGPGMVAGAVRAGRGIDVVQARDDLNLVLEPASGSIVGPSSKSLPSPVGHQLSWCTPLGIVTNAIRRGTPAAAAAAAPAAAAASAACDQRGNERRQGRQRDARAQPAQEMPAAQRPVTLSGTCFVRTANSLPWLVSDEL